MSKTPSNRGQYGCSLLARARLLSPWAWWNNVGWLVAGPLEEVSIPSGNGPTRWETRTVSTDIGTRDGEGRHRLEAIRRALLEPLALSASGHERMVDGRATSG